MLKPLFEHGVIILNYNIITPWFEDVSDASSHIDNDSEIHIEIKIQIMFIVAYQEILKYNVNIAWNLNEAVSLLEIAPLRFSGKFSLRGNYA